MSGSFRGLKNKTLYWVLGAIITVVLLATAENYYYLNHIKYVELEERIIQIHSEMRQNLPKESEAALEHFGAGLSIRNGYNLWSEESELRKLFKKYGVHHPDDMSGLILETYLRSKKGVPFRLHRLIKLTVGFYEAEDQTKYLEKLKSEFYRFKEYKKK